MSSLAHQRVLRTVRLLPQAVKIGILESEIKQEGLKPEPEKIIPKPPVMQVKIPDSTARELEELTAQIKALTNSLSNAEIANAELTEAKKKLESEIGSIKSDYEKRRRTLESEAQNNAKRIADKARDQAITEGQVKGYEEGIKKARQEIEQEYHDRFSKLSGIIETVGKKLDSHFNELVKLHQPKMIRLWSEMLKRMLNRQIELNPNAIDSVLSGILSRLSDKNQILIYVSPDDIKNLDGKLDEKFQEALRGAKRVELKSDPNVENGSCIVETGLGVYDARWKTQFSQIETVIDEIFQQVSKDE